MDLLAGAARVTHTFAMINRQGNEISWPAASIGRGQLLAAIDTAITRAVTCFIAGLPESERPLRRRPLAAARSPAPATTHACRSRRLGDRADPIGDAVLAAYASGTKGRLHSSAPAYRGTVTQCVVAWFEASCSWWMGCRTAGISMPSSPPPRQSCLSSRCGSPSGWTDQPDAAGSERHGAPRRRTTKDCASVTAYERSARWLFGTT